MHVLCCADPLNRRAADPAFEDEVAAARALALPVDLLDLEALLDGEAERAVRAVVPAEPAELGVYRGWMLSTAQYRLLYEALLARGIRLLNTPAAYAFC